MSRFVRYEEFGGPQVLTVVQVEPPRAGPGQLRVKVAAAGINPVDAKIFQGGPAAQSYGAEPPCGVGHDFAGVIDDLGDGVTGFALGDRVFGGKRNFALADFVVIGTDGMIVPMPEGLSFDVAGSLAVVGRTAWASVESLDITAQDTVLVSAAAGGVGVLAAQLALRKGAVVLGTAGEANLEFLRSLGVIPVRYGEGLVDRLREAAPDGITAVLDSHGEETVRAGIELGVRPERINTVAARQLAGLGIGLIGGAAAGNNELGRVAQLLADGELVLPIDSVYPLESVVEAYERLGTGHLRGKIVLAME